MPTPLADILRPVSLDDFAGQSALIGKNGPIRRMIENKKISSMILWGPPGCGKTTLAHIIAKSIDAVFVPFSAISSGVKEVRTILDEARQKKDFFKTDTILFVDEIHRFSKSQQDAFLPAVESGAITLIGATTENPGFEINAPLISRARVYRLLPLSEIEMRRIITRALTQFPHAKYDEEALKYIISYANGDARTALNAIELTAPGRKKITLAQVESTLQQKSIQYDKSGDNHYDTVSAFIKSMRGSKPDATLHYLARMLKAGEDPVFIARRMVIFASEDVGNAQPTALVLATSCMQSVHMVGMPEARIMLAQTATYLATAKKSTASYDGISRALHDLETMPIAPIPLHLRNSSNNVMKQEKYGVGHIRYPWKEEEKGKVVDQEYMPENLVGKTYYRDHKS